MTEPLLKLEEAAKLAQVSPRTMRDWALKGTLPATRVGRGWRISRPALASFLGMEPAPDPGPEANE